MTEHLLQQQGVSRGQGALVRSEGSCAWGTRLHQHQGNAAPRGAGGGRGAVNPTGCWRRPCARSTAQSFLPSSWAPAAPCCLSLGRAVTQWGGHRGCSWCTGL